MNKWLSKLDVFGWIKVVLTIVLLLCLLSMPYGFYNLVRFVAMIGFGILCYDAWQKGVTPLAVTYGGLALLFQPFAKIVLGRDIWNCVDVAVAVFLIILLVRDSKLN